MDRLFELQARYDNRKSFYGKAHVYRDECGNIRLLSYETNVAGYNPKTGEIWGELGAYSRTTDRHIREFYKQIENGETFAYCYRVYDLAF